ncbi:FAD:protein FMN transferase [Sporichthya polymorpha]|uniref:FAD:protein FMN transferase n=1 Tax=Sporichthya polymorpha TaxID=35751 RepID=UPI0003773885|nr:FAD:protein FMN transferase [Sporichthya polymorpha]
MTADGPRRSWVEQIMGMPISLLARGGPASSAAAAAAAEAVFAELREIDATFSTYRAESVVSRLGRGEVALEDCPDDVREVAQLCERARTLTDGLFDARRPDDSWDPSGYVKGWAVQRAARHLPQTGELDWCLNAGGDVVVRCGGDRSFNVGIADPRDATRAATVLAWSSGGVATSGTAVRGAHLYDPRTRGPALTHWASVTVAGTSLELADVLATAAFVAGPSWTEIVALGPGCIGLAIGHDGALVPTGGWPRPDC